MCLCVCVSAVCSCHVEYMEVTTLGHQLLLSGGVSFIFAAVSCIQG